MNKIDKFIFDYADSQSEAVKYFHKLLLRKYKLTLRLNFQIPFYCKYNPVCFFNPLIEDGVEIAFSRGNELSDKNGLLRNLGRKYVFGLKLDELESMKLILIEQLIEEAIFLDELHRFKLNGIEKANTLIEPK